MRAAEFGVPDIAGGMPHLPSSWKNVKKVIQDGNSAK
jgi:hypothetical protein